MYTPKIWIVLCAIMTVLFIVSLSNQQGTIARSNLRACGNFSADLYPGISRVDVPTLQKILNMDLSTQVAAVGPGSPGMETNYYGPLTAAAVLRFQAKYGLPTAGRAGPQTRAVLNEICKDL